MVREQAASNLEMETAIVNADLRTEHAAKIHKLQLDLKWKHGREIQDAQKLPEEKFCKLCLYLSYWYGELGDGKTGAKRDGIEC